MRDAAPMDCSGGAEGGLRIGGWRGEIVILAFRAA
jgi:hypothetical protein